VSRVNVDAIAFTDGRFKLLAELLGYIDADHARSKVEYVWLACTIRGELELPRWVVEQHLGPTGPEALVECELARWTSGRGDSRTRRMYICGARGRTEWFTRLQGQSSKGGKARAEKTSRQAGKFTSQQDGAETSPLALAPAPAPAPAQAETREEPPTPQGGFEVVAEKCDQAFGDLGRARAKPVRDRRKPKSTPTELERATALRVLERLSAHNGVRYSGTEKHIGLIAARLRDGVDEAELRAIVVHCAHQWRDKPAMLEFLRPETLFGPETISKYLDPARSAYADEIAEFRAQNSAQPTLTLVPEAG
jgi:uncharacterized phage protein (TIGR02220 family)